MQGRTICDEDRFAAVFCHEIFGRDLTCNASGRG
jgi:hypothetical protein